MKTSAQHLSLGLPGTYGKQKTMPDNTLQTVNYVDLERYAGTWYEIASYPQLFEKGCSHAKATYELKEDYVEVTNESIKNGRHHEIKGKAYVVPETGNSKLKVQLFWPFRSDYWIVELSEDYSWAVVSDPMRRTLWILSRTPDFDEILYDWLIERLVRKGFDPSKIQMMIQN